MQHVGGMLQPPWLFRRKASPTGGAKKSRMRKHSGFLTIHSSFFMIHAKRIRDFGLWQDYIDFVKNRTLYDSACLDARRLFFLLAFYRLLQHSFSQSWLAPSAAGLCIGRQQFPWAFGLFLPGFTAGPLPIAGSCCWRPAPQVTFLLGFLLKKTISVVTPSSSALLVVSRLSISYVCFGCPDDLPDVTNSP